MRGLRVTVNGRPLPLLLLAFWVADTASTLQAQCNTYVDTYDEVTRLNGNAVQGYVETSLWGPCKDYWLPGVQGWVHKDSQQIQAGGPVWGEYAGGWVSWEFTPVTLSASGPGAYSSIGFHFAYCASCDDGRGRYVPPYDDNWDGYDGGQLTVQRPTISGLHGAWYFGPNFVPNNGYYDATRFTADPKYPNPETEVERPEIQVRVCFER